MRPLSDLKLRVGESRDLTFSGLGTAGYSWSWEIEGDQEAVAVSLQASPARTPTQTPSGVPPNNYSLDETFTVQALKIAQIRIHFVLRRPWEKKLEPVAEHWVSVTVAD